MTPIHHRKVYIYFLVGLSTSIILKPAACANAFSSPDITRGHLSHLHPSISHRNKSNIRKSMTDLTKRRHSAPSQAKAINSRGGTSMKMVTDSSSLFFNNAPMNQSLLIFAATNAVGFIISLLTGSHLHLDLVGTGAYTLAALPPLLMSSSASVNALPLTPRTQVSCAAMAIWGTKLAGFLFFRALKVKHDARLETTLSTVGGMFGFWFVSLLWGVICSLPHTLGTTSSNPGNPTALTVGTAMYVVGLLTESMADYQKWTFKQTNPGQFCNVGLWSVSQHPNFFGNLVLWGGILVMNMDSLIEPSNVAVVGFKASLLWRSRRIFLALLSPLFMWTLFSGQANGSITNAVELANKRYGSDAGYRDYVESVPLIIPNLVSWLKQLLSVKE